jgi:hypothetical protein
LKQDGRAGKRNPEKGTGRSYFKFGGNDVDWKRFGFYSDDFFLKGRNMGHFLISQAGKEFPDHRVGYSNRKVVIKTLVGNFVLERKVKIIQGVHKLTSSFVSLVSLVSFDSFDVELFHQVIQLFQTLSRDAGKFSEKVLKPPVPEVFGNVEVPRPALILPQQSLL